MPRTKAPKKRVTEAAAKKTTDTAVTKELDKQIKEVKDLEKSMRKTLERECAELIRQYRKQSREQLLDIPVAFVDKPIAEICDGSSTTGLYSSCINVTGASIIHGTQKSSRTLKKGNSKKRSVSVCNGDDEGYRTTESTGSTASSRSGSRHQSRARNMLTVTHNRTTRASRSLSRTAQKQQSNSSTMLRVAQTPKNKEPINSYGMITPKVKPNTPQVLLRRPKQGEVAMSMQGSPLFTGSVVADTMANVNIPLIDGRMLSIQPQRGLRMSQIPDLDAETKRQLEALRDNLTKVCAVADRR